jgi:signal transduction histidine kinase
VQAMQIRARFLITAGCALLVAFIGYGDYLQGNENSMLLFYMIPIGLAVWYSGMAAGMVMVILSMAAALLADRLSGVPDVGIWNNAAGLGYYLVFVVLLSRWRHAIANIQVEVAQRTSELRSEIAARRQLEQDIGAVTEKERARLGRELHDSLCQHLAGTSLKAQTVAKQIRRGEMLAAENADAVVSLLDRGIRIARDIARGLFSAELEGAGLNAALAALAEMTTQHHAVNCKFAAGTPLVLPQNKATQLYWIAHEAVTNAVRHAEPTEVRVSLAQAGGHIELTVEDNGRGVPPFDEQQSGIGLHVMQQRAEMAGGMLRINPRAQRGTIVRCLMSLNGQEGDEAR